MSDGMSSATRDISPMMSWGMVDDDMMTGDDGDKDAFVKRVSMVRY